HVTPTPRATAVLSIVTVPSGFSSAAARPLTHTNVATMTQIHARFIALSSGGLEKIVAAGVYHEARYSTLHDHLPHRARRHPRHRSLTRHRWALVWSAPRRSRCRRDQGGGSRRGRRVAHVAALQGRRGRGVSPLQSQQARSPARSQAGGG